MLIAKRTYSSSVAKRAYSMLLLVLSLGLIFSQICNVICASSDCSAPATGRRAANIEQTGHCHQENTPPQQERPSDDQHQCPAHGSAVSIPPETISTAVSHHVWQSAAELVSSYDILFDLAGNGAYRSCHFRSPPRRPLFTILRI